MTNQHDLMPLNPNPDFVIGHGETKEVTPLLNPKFPAFRSDSMGMMRALNSVIAMRHQQNAKWGVQNHDPMTWNGILGEEFGEFSKEVVEHKFDTRSDLTHHFYKMRAEAVDVAAVAIQIIECIDRNHLPAPIAKAAA